MKNIVNNGTNRPLKEMVSMIFFDQKINFQLPSSI